MDVSNLQPTTRFSDRVEHYVKSRPTYPQQVLDFLGAELRITPAMSVADIGCGSGILAELFVKNGYSVRGVEPNAEMRQAAITLLAKYPNFTATDGTAENTELDSASVEVITVGQAFHWFQPERTKQEFLRILKPRGWVLLLWNDRVSNADRFQQGYEKLLQTFGKDYSQIDHRNLESSGDFERFFSPEPYRLKTFPNFQVLDFEGLRSRLISSSYIPAEGQPEYPEMIASLKCLYHAFEADNRVILKYETRLYYGQLVQKKAGS